MLASFDTCEEELFRAGAAEVHIYALLSWKVTWVKLSFSWICISFRFTV